MDVIIHIGKQKTGSTAIQTRLFAIRDQLARRDIIYSRAFGKKKAQNLKNVFREGKTVKGGDAESMSAAFEAELARKPSMLILSNENLFSSDKGVMTAIRDMIAAAGGRPKIYAYLRRPDEHASSLYQQRVRTGQKTWSMDEFLDAMIEKKYYNFGGYLDGWADVFGRDAIHARLFHRDILKEGPFEDFVDWIGLSTAGIKFPDPKAEKPKESFDAAGVDVMRFFRKYNDDNPGAFDERFMEGVRNRIRHSNSGRRLALTAAQAEKISTATRADLERLAYGYLTPREAEIILAPTKVSGPGTQSGAYEVIGRALDVIGKLDGVLSAPAPGADKPHPLDPTAQELLGILRAYAAENPDKLDAATIAKAERLLRERAPEPEPDPEVESGTLSPDEERRRERRARRAPSGDYAVFLRLVEICGGLTVLSKVAKQNKSGKSLDRQKRREERGARKRKQEVRAARVAAAPAAAVPAAVAEGDSEAPSGPSDGREERRRKRKERRAQEAAATAAGAPVAISSKRQERLKRKEKRKAAAASAAADASPDPVASPETQPA